MDTNHTTSLKFLWAVGEVTPSSTILAHHFQKQSARIMVDAGITPGGREQLMMPKWIGILVLSHGHVDHNGKLPEFYVQNPESRIFVPKGNKDIVAHNVHEAHRLSMQENPEEKMWRWIKQAHDLLDDVYLNIPKKGIKRGKGGNRTAKSDHRHDMINAMHEQEGNLENAITQICNHLSIWEEATGDIPEGDQLIRFFREEIKTRHDELLHELRNRGVISRGDVSRSINAITELTIGSYHRILKMWGRDIRVRFDPTGHLVTGPACSIGFELPIPGSSKRNILFSGDQWNPKLWYEWTNPDYTPLYNKFDTIVLESTYGGSTHPNRANELRKLDAKILDAIKSKTDVLVVTLALERPIYVLYEILKCLENNAINPESVDISYFWESIAKLFKHFPKGDIRSTVKPYIKPLIQPSLTPKNKESILHKLGKSWPKPRIIISSCGFFHPEWPSAKALSYMYPQEYLAIVSPNFHGEPGSNGANLFRGEEYQIGTELYEPRPWHELFVAKGFSGHWDRDHLTRYARKNSKDGAHTGKGAKIFLNHGSEQSRNALAHTISEDEVIRSKKAKVYLPKIGRTYKATQ